MGARAPRVKTRTIDGETNAVSLWTVGLAGSKAAVFAVHISDALVAPHQEGVTVTLYALLRGRFVQRAMSSYSMSAYVPGRQKGALDPPTKKDDVFALKDALVEVPLDLFIANREARSAVEGVFEGQTDAGVISGDVSSFGSLFGGVFRCARWNLRPFRNPGAAEVEITIRNGNLVDLILDCRFFIKEEEEEEDRR